MKVIVKANQTHLRNEFHFNLQKRNPSRVFRDKTKYTRKEKHREIYA